MTGLTTKASSTLSLLSSETLVDMVFFSLNLKYSQLVKRLYLLLNILPIMSLSTCIRTEFEKNY